MHMSPPCMSTGRLKNGQFLLYSWNWWNSPIFLQQISHNSCIFKTKSLCQAWQLLWSIEHHSCANFGQNTSFSRCSNEYWKGDRMQSIPPAYVCLCRNIVEVDLKEIAKEHNPYWPAGRNWRNSMVIYIIITGHSGFMGYGHGDLWGFISTWFIYNKSML